MDQQNNGAVPGASGQDGQPVPTWGSAADGVDRGAAAPNREVPAGQDGGAREASAQGQPAQGWGAPVPGQHSATWGTAPAGGQVPNSGAGWGAPQQQAPNAASRTPNGTWTAKKGLLIAAAALVLGAAAGAGAYAAGNGSGASANNAQGAGANGQFGPGGQGGMAGQGGQSGTNGSGMPPGGTGMNGGPGGLGMGSAGVNAAVHSEYVVLQDSNYVTMAGQTGTVTDVSATSLTVKSEDGFSRTYTVGSDVAVTQGVRQRGGGSTGSTLSLSNVTAGSSVRVTALKGGDSYKAQAIQLVTSGTTAGSGTN